MQRSVSVSQLNNYIKRVLINEPVLMNIAVCGEISKLTKHSSGHWYFTLKDENSKINCFLPSDRVGYLRFELCDGLQITAFGYVSVYEKGGYYSLNIRDVEAEGEGALMQAFEALKAKLLDEGVFDEAHKKSIPPFPKRIGVITSPTGAAIKDIITTVKRRDPMADILLYPVLVQGSKAGASIAAAIRDINLRFPELDVLIVGRGGGSAEDLWAFNEEVVARAIYDSEIPVISAVGHETDVVIADYAADVRGATPTAAAELAVPHLDSIKDRIAQCSPVRMYNMLANEASMMQAHIKELSSLCSGAMQRILSDAQYSIDILKRDADASNPLNSLNRGYSIIKKDGQWVSSVDRLRINDRIVIMLGGGEIEAEIKEVRIEKE